MPRKGENIYKRKDGRWEGRYRKFLASDSKKRYGYIYGKTYREVKEKLCEVKMTQKTQSVEKSISENFTFEVFAQDWLKNTSPFLKESTIAKYRNCLETYILPEFRMIDIFSMNNTRIEQFRNKMLISGGKNGKQLSAKYVADMLSIIRSVQKYVSAQRPELACPIHSVSVKCTSKQIRVLNEQEQNRLFYYLIHSESTRDIGILLSMFTGLRIGEVCALKWENIDLTERTISVICTIQRIQVRTETTKTKLISTLPKSHSSIRQIPIPSIIYDKLVFARKAPSAYLLSGCMADLIEPRSMQNYFKSVMKKCNIKHATFHTLRHTFATRCVSTGVDIKILSEILGHANVSTTLNRYVHPSMEQKRQNIDKLSDLFTVK